MEVGAKTVKRLIADNTGHNGDLDRMHFNGLCSSTEIHLTETQNFHLQCASLVIQSGISFRFLQEDTPHNKQGKCLSEHTKRLPPLAIGDCVHNTEPDKALPTKMGQNWRHHRSLPI